VTWPAVTKAIMLTAWNNILYVLPATAAQWVWVDNLVLPAEAPPLFEFLWQHVALLLIFDAEYFAWHWLHHSMRPLYKHVHSVHHQYHSPHAWVTQYLHPYELMSIGLMSNTAPLLLGAHPLTAFSYQIMAIQVKASEYVKNVNKNKSIIPSQRLATGILQ
jgi:cholesterol 25-hydroxylase